jgi:hypothetical protein
MTPADIITEVRNLVQDTRSPYRYSDTLMLGWVNQTLKRMSVLRPDLFSFIGDISTIANTVLQSCPSDSLRLIEIFQIKNGDAVTEVSRDVLDQMYPNWVNEAAGTPVNFMRHVRSPNKFFLYPRPSAGVILVGEYAQVPPTYTLSQTIALLPDAYLPVAVDGVVFLAESVDNEHVNSNRAKLFQDSFAQTLATGLQVRTITDTEEGGLDPRQVI